MAKFVTFDDGYGTYNFRAVFSSTATKTKIRQAVERKLLKNLRSRGYGKEDMPSKNEIISWLEITGMKDGTFYEPHQQQHWNDNF